MKTIIYFMFVALLSSIISCSPTNEVGDTGNMFFQSKRYREAVKERDSLLALCRKLQYDTTRLGSLSRSFQKENKKLNGEYAFLKADYAALDSLQTVLKTKYAALEKEQVKLKTEYKNYSDSTEKRLTSLTEELKSKSDELNKVNLKQGADELNKVNLKQDDSQKKIPEVKVTRSDSLTSDLYNSITKALTDYNADELSTRMSNGKIHVSMSNKLLFKPGTMSLEDRGRKALKKLTLVLNRYKNLDIDIEGHTDSIPTKNALYKDNWDLSAIRAAAVVRLLSEEYDVSPAKLSASGRGEFLPVASNQNVEGRAKNRRIEIIISQGISD